MKDYQVKLQDLKNYNSTYFLKSEDDKFWDKAEDEFCKESPKLPWHEDPRMKKDNSVEITRRAFQKEYPIEYKIFMEECDNSMMDYFRYISTTKA